MPSWNNDRLLSLVSRRPSSIDLRQFLVFVVPSGRLVSPLLPMLARSRNFDIAARFYEDPGINRELAECAEFVMTGGLSKFHAASMFLENWIPNGVYDGYLFLDGDLEFDAEILSEFLAFTHAIGLDLAQPSLTRDSHCYWKVVYHQPGFAFRRTSFVEVMAPYISGASLAKLSPTFGKSISGYGLDFVWPKLIGGDCIGVVDAFQVRHAERVDYVRGPFYRYLSLLGIDISEEARRVEAEYGITRIQPHSRRGYYKKRGLETAEPALLESVYLPGIERFTDNQRVIDTVMKVARFGPSRREESISASLNDLGLRLDAQSMLGAANYSAKKSK